MRDFISRSWLRESAALFLLSFSIVACSSSDATNDADRGPDGGDTNGDGDGKPDEDGGVTVSGSRFFLPTGEPDNTAAPTIAVDPRGNTHAVYPAYAGGGAYYAFCEGGCASPDLVKVVRFPTDGTVTNAMIALDAQGRPRILLASYAKVEYATCDTNCLDPSGWKVGTVVAHGAEQDVTGEALALDPQGRPRFILHTYKAYLGIGQKDPKTYYMTCDADCTSAAAWSTNLISATDIWESSTLRFDATGRPRVAAVGPVEIDGTRHEMAVYYECNGDCTTEAGWTGIGLGPVYESELEAVTIKPTVTMALAKSGAPRIAFMARTPEDGKAIVYMTCDADCTADNWNAVVVSRHESLNSGLDLALDADDHPRLVYTLNYNIGLAHCDDAECADEKATWGLTKVEAGEDIPTDDIFLYKNCTVGAWFLHDPSIALTADGQPRVGYQARDISSSGPQPGCEAGTDMTWSRLAVLASAK